MNPYTPYLAAMHLQEVLDEAALDRRAKLAKSDTARLPAWRRSLGGILVSAARVADPCIELVNGARSNDGSRAFAA
jgi:hypothetical protein